MVYEKLIHTLINSGAHKATKFISPKHVIKATRELFRKKKGTRQHLSKNPIQINLTIGGPNFRERQFIKMCQKAGAKFPVSKIRLQFPPKSR